MRRSSEAVPKTAPPPTKHRLENASAFWFDNPSAKSKQATWRS